MTAALRALRWGTVVIAVAATTVIVVGSAGGQASGSPGFTASDYHWYVSGSTDATLTLGPGGNVSFSYPSGASMHNADFGGGPAPSSCTQSAGLVSGTVPPLPHQPTASGWSGSCTFNTPGTYTFHCDQHPSMTGTIVVQAASSSTSTSTANSPPASTSTSTTSVTTTSVSVGQTPTAGTGVVSHGSTAPRRPPAGAHTLARRQRGERVQGAVDVAIPGSRLEVDLLTVATAGKKGATPVGRWVRHPAHGGIVRFSVLLSTTGRRALHRRGVLQLTVTLTVRPPRGRAVVRHAAVTLTA